MILLGITGAIGHGKSSLAAALTEAEKKSLHLESFHVIAEVANELHKKLKKTPAPGDYAALNDWLGHLPAILKKVVHLQADPTVFHIRVEDIQANPLKYKKLFEHLDALNRQPELATQVINDDNKSTYRPILQWLGGYLVEQVDPAIWWRELIRRTKRAKADGIQLVTIGGVRYPKDTEIVREAKGLVIDIIRPGQPEADVNDPTERERRLIQPDITVVNNGSLADLARCARTLLKDVRTGNFQPQYQCQEK